jgi:tRNA(His) 5'-end guanylyltransferase
MGNDDIENRMKKYESVSKMFLTRRTPMIIRLDGKAFHSLTKDMDTPWDENFTRSMMETTYELCEEIQGAQLAYCQSDEISILVQDYDKLTTSAWFDKNIQKIVSVSSSIATMTFNVAIREYIKGFYKQAYFDSRAFTLPKEEVCNYFIWRQQDSTRNSIQGLAQSNFSHKELQGLNNSKVQDKLMLEKNINWNDTPTKYKRGFCAVNKDSGWEIDEEIPIFTRDRQYIEKLVYLDKDE